MFVVHPRQYPDRPPTEAAPMVMVGDLELSLLDPRPGSVLARGTRPTFTVRVANHGVVPLRRQYSIVWVDSRSRRREAFSVNLAPGASRTEVLGGFTVRAAGTLSCLIEGCPATRSMTAEVVDASARRLFSFTVAP